MKILVFSDSHGSNLLMMDMIEKKQPDAVFHLGDLTSDAREIACVFPKIKLCNVRGNNDWDDGAPWGTAVRFGGVPFYLCHGHREHARQGIELVAQAALNAGCRVALYGHTHKPFSGSFLGVQVFNPGSISLPVNGRPSCLELTAENGALAYQFLDTE